MSETLAELEQRALQAAVKWNEARKNNRSITPPNEYVPRCDLIAAEKALEDAVNRFRQHLKGNGSVK